MLYKSVIFAQNLAGSAENGPNQLSKLLTPWQKSSMLFTAEAVGHWRTLALSHQLGGQHLDRGVGSIISTTHIYRVVVIDNYSEIFKMKYIGGLFSSQPEWLVVYAMQQWTATT